VLAEAPQAEDAPAPTIDRSVDAIDASTEEPTDAGNDARPDDVSLGEIATRDGATDSAIDVSTDGGDVEASTCPAPPPEGCPWGDAGDAGSDAGIASFARDVSPIIQRHCSTCHAIGNDAGLWPLGTFEEVWDWQRLIAADLINCTMPPADAGVVSAEERATLFNWLYCGTPDN
jgi:hypothetical protein